ncbi:hypothetical protein C1645_824037 [Glomus cerebriforme]|uniref:Uncharacterized protein n=1 Tax=Glomus cerebriforme TaxID=658196 RepID=A0A397SVE8_9GLOM|nr:hypothetical protein C1645_824037 [Glomus cerebriforme]
MSILRRNFPLAEDLTKLKNLETLRNAYLTVSYWEKQPFAEVAEPEIKFYELTPEQETIVKEKALELLEEKEEQRGNEKGKDQSGLREAIEFKDSEGKPTRVYDYAGQKEAADRSNIDKNPGSRKLGVDDLISRFKVYTEAVEENQEADLHFEFDHELVPGN